MLSILSNSPLSESRSYVPNLTSRNSFVWCFEIHSLHQCFTEHVLCGKTFNRAFNFLFLCGGWEYWGIEPLWASYTQGKFPTTKLYSQAQNVSVLRSAHHHQTPLGKLSSSNHCCKRGIPRVARNQPAWGCFSARNATSVSRYLPHPLVMLTTVAASSRCNNL